MERDQFIRYLHNIDNLDQTSLDALEKLTFEKPWFQTGWILYLKNLKKINSPKYETILKKVAILVPDRKMLHRYLNNEIRFSTNNLTNIGQSGYELVDQGIDASGSDSLIDRFLSSGSGGFSHRTTQKEISESTDNNYIIEKSISESDELITETLANIYFKQKNYEKALEAYKKLSLKYPEKSIYFAARIKEIEVIKNNT